MRCYETHSRCANPKVKRKAIFSLNEMKFAHDDERFKLLVKREDRRDLNKSSSQVAPASNYGNTSGDNYVGFPLEEFSVLSRK